MFKLNNGEVINPRYVVSVSKVQNYAALDINKWCYDIRLPTQTISSRHPSKKGASIERDKLIKAVQKC